MTGIIPCLRYRDATGAIDWLGRVFGFETQLVVPGPEGTVAHAQLRIGGSMIMLGSVFENEYGHFLKQPDQVGGHGTQGIYLVVDDPDAVYRKAIDHGATVAIPIKDEDYGGRGFTVKDPEGHLWSVGSYNPWE